MFTGIDKEILACRAEERCFSALSFFTDFDSGRVVLEL